MGAPVKTKIENKASEGIFGIWFHFSWPLDFGVCGHLQSTEWWVFVCNARVEQIRVTRAFKCFQMVCNLWEMIQPIHIHSKVNFLITRNLGSPFLPCLRQERKFSRKKTRLTKVDTQLRLFVGLVKHCHSTSKYHHLWGIEIASIILKDPILFRWSVP